MIRKAQLLEEQKIAQEVKADNGEMSQKTAGRPLRHNKGNVLTEDVSEINL